MQISRRALLVATGLGAASLAGRPAHSTPFPDKVGERRLFVVFGASPPFDRLDMQLARVASPRFRMRDFDVVEVRGGGPIRINGEERASPTARELRDAFRVTGDFAVRVVGKDGEVKLATTRVVNLDQLEALADEEDAAAQS